MCLGLHRSGVVFPGQSSSDLIMWVLSKGLRGLYSDILFVMAGVRKVWVRLVQYHCLKRCGFVDCIAPLSFPNTDLLWLFMSDETRSPVASLFRGWHPGCLCQSASLCSAAWALLIGPKLQPGAHQPLFRLWKTCSAFESLKPLSS